MRVYIRNDLSWEEHTLKTVRKVKDTIAALSKICQNFFLHFCETFLCVPWFALSMNSPCFNLIYLTFKDLPSKLKSKWYTIHLPIHVNIIKLNRVIVIVLENTILFALISLLMDHLQNVLDKFSNCVSLIVF